jgi:hypothetical protein
MKPPTVHEAAGIFMLALVTALLISHPSAGSHAVPGTNGALDNLDAMTIEGIENAASPRQ